MIKSDEPIMKPEEDLLGRANLASVIADEIRNIEASDGFVVGVLGPWGSGKTSLINLIQNKLAEEPALTVLTFNPWMFSGADQLVESFFIELAAQLRLGPSKMQNIANILDTYGEMFSPLGSILGSVPVAGTIWGLLGGATKAFNNYYKARKKGVAETRDKLAKELRDLSQPIVVVIDDVDRLRTSEIRDIFKLVRLIANLPNIVYVLAFDRLRVEQALAEDGLSGRDYLEKIIQAAYDIPAIPPAMLSQQIIDAINEALAEVPNRGPFDERRWQGVFREIVFPLFRNMRDVRRYAASLPGTVRSLDGRVALVDVLAFEATRVFMPDLFAAISRSQQALTAPEERTLFDDLKLPEDKLSIDALLKTASQVLEVL
ncbi:MAG: KAP family P-loop NTPase fold protein [Burkholderiales bacterium]